ncbi:MAG TPA: DUF397 domain-containing protein [Streptosporangiaceae bacterium]
MLSVIENGISYMPSDGIGQEQEWRRASFCTAGECVEVTERDGAVLLRDSKDPSGCVLSFSVEEFRTFVLGIQAGEFDDLSTVRANRI